MIAAVVLSPSHNRCAKAREVRLRRIAGVAGRRGLVREVRRGEMV
jgi:hypothetical protein